MTLQQSAWLKRQETDLPPVDYPDVSKDYPDQDYDLANIIAAGRAVERAESNLATFKKHQRLHLLGWGLVALTLAGAIYELIRW